jgi:hypothetical protein
MAQRMLAPMMTGTIQPERGLSATTSGWPSSSTTTGPPAKAAVEPSTIESTSSGDVTLVMSLSLQVASHISGFLHTGSAIAESKLVLSGTVTQA